MVTDFSPITELPGSRATREQHARLYHRYHTAGQYIAGKRVLEVACGAGLGLGYLARRANTVVGGDCTQSLLRTAQSHYQGRMLLVLFDVHRLPFRDRSFDVVVLFEAIYYFSRIEDAISEIRRLLFDNGTALIGSVNRDWSEFTPSLLSTRYFSVPELRDLLIQHGFGDLEFFGAFPAEAASLGQKVISLLRRMAVALDLVPKTLAAREHLKRLFYGRLTPLGPELEEGAAKLFPLVPIAGDTPNTQYKVFYVAARTR